MTGVQIADARKHAETIVRAVLDAAEPGACVRRGWAISLDDDSPCVVIAIGKASAAMAGAAAELLGERVVGGVITVVPELVEEAEAVHPKIAAMPCDHPLPTERNVEAAEAIERCVRGAPGDATVVVCISGGGSAHLTAPGEGVTVEDLAECTRELLRCGCTIDELNCVRKHAERLKGGGLAVASAPRRVVSLIMSDVVGDRLDSIASGPTSPDPTTFAEALGIVARHGAVVPPAVRVVLESGATGHRPETPKPGDAVFRNCEHRIVAGNRLAVESAGDAARALGFEVAAIEHDIVGEAAEIGRAFARRRLDAGTCVVIGGETTVDVGGAPGVGGRNHELALAAAIELRDRPGCALLAFATDGIDGSTDAAGAIVDGETYACMTNAGVDPHLALADHDSGGALSAIGASLRTGATGTNINDVAVLLGY